MHDQWLWLGSVIAFAFAMSSTPGPNNTLLFRSGVRFGLRHTVPHMIGVSIGFPLLFLVVACGAGAILRMYPLIYVIMRWAGIGYLLWLAWHIASEPVSPIDAQSVAGDAQRRPMSMFHAMLFQWINPKAWIIASGTLLTYTHPNAGQLREILAITIVFLCVNPCSCLLWAWFGTASARMIKSTRATVSLRYGMAALLMLSLVPLVAEQFAAPFR